MEIQKEIVHLGTKTPYFVYECDWCGEFFKGEKRYKIHTKNCWKKHIGA